MTANAFALSYYDMRTVIEDEAGGGLHIQYTYVQVVCWLSW